ncbi:MAG: hypothetical protein UW27_C0001G0069 [Parcubacteria group bacterium GW2011_GWA1_44_13]|uniref:Uncharacterized protein n=1 Tax=Candidatus Nomurabacteria bacterium GW2011_GWB1_44_12 TaxID=1618748 RepID=A0A837IEC7_9BACT|nr:MAG: hypothetical protein UW25_C0001G0070 [Candidatus Nomurabacteria bacterium GW2011_GWB1_44_12]KKT38573.1 MAG: hypothetical protein UW27_C0001G0069 [Parcubacteria group bacterium GW2011_GWA1_44_13]HBB44431.1 hypothetical protein [Candidatus Yonathbacteria bacterium]
MVSQIEMWYCGIMIIQIVENTISLEELREIAKEYYIDMVKGVVDISNEKVAFGGEYHMDANVKILENGSNQADVWGFNLYVNQPAGNRVEFTSLINIRPHVGNKSMEVQDEGIRTRMQDIIERKIS